MECGHHEYKAIAGTWEANSPYQKSTKKHKQLGRPSQEGSSASPKKQCHKVPGKPRAGLGLIQCEFRVGFGLFRIALGVVKEGAVRPALGLTYRGFGLVQGWFI